ncbi:MAG: hypothetical protein NTZ56_20315 [Acidobacteria bacterium]|nr:hypothetical protein [Acidobacteriota bacterium]
MRFLVLKPTGGAQPLEVIVNWPALLKGGEGMSVAGRESAHWSSRLQSGHA